MNYPNNDKGRIQKTTKSSDRRMASGRKPEKFLLNSLSTPATKVLEIPKGREVPDNRTVKRSAAGKTWEDKSLLEWDPKHFRMFVGNLGSDANDNLLLEAFGRYKSLSKVKVPIDSRTGKNKGYGFVAFVDSEDYLNAYKEMNGKYVGQHPVQLKKAETKIKSTRIKKRK